MNDGPEISPLPAAVDSNLGITRRQLLQRGAVVGGTLLWVAPAVQTFVRPAFAQNVSPRDFSYIAFCYRCDTATDNNTKVDGKDPRCCVKFELNDDGTVQGCEENHFATPSCLSFTFDDTDDDCGNCDLFNVISRNAGKTIEVTFKDGVTNCEFVKGQGVGKCADECVEGEITSSKLTFTMCDAPR